MDKVFTAEQVRHTLNGDIPRLKRIVFGTSRIVRKNDYEHFLLCERLLIHILDKLTRLDMMREHQAILAFQLKVDRLSYLDGVHLNLN